MPASQGLHVEEDDAPSSSEKVPAAQPTASPAAAASARAWSPCRERERERDRQTERQRERQTDRDRDRDRQRERERQRQRERERAPGPDVDTAILGGGCNERHIRRHARLHLRPQRCVCRRRRMVQTLQHHSMSRISHSRPRAHRKTAAVRGWRQPRIHTISLQTFARCCGFRV